MSQVDRLNYLPLLFWFVIFFIMLYIFIFCRFIPAFYTVFKTRRLFFLELIKFHYFYAFIIKVFVYISILPLSISSVVTSNISSITLAFLIR